MSEPSEPSGRRPHKDKRATKTATPPPDSASDDSGDDDGERRYVRLSARGWPSSPIIERSTLLLANRKEERENLRYRPTLFLSALGVTLLLAAGMAFWQRARLEPLWSAVLANPEQAALAHLSLLVLLVGLPLGAGIALYALGWQCLRLLRITRYLGAFRRALRRHLATYAPLYRLGVMPTGVRFTPTGQPSAQLEEPCERLLRRASRAVLLGEAGAGKTTALYAYAARLAQRRSILPIFFGFAPLPVIISLPGYARTSPDERGLRLSYIVSQVRRFSTAGLASQTERLLRRGRIVLLCDGFDDIPELDRPSVSDSLAALAPPNFGRARMIIACQLATYLSQPDDLGKLRQFDRLVLAPLHHDDMLLALRQQRLPKRPKGEQSAGPTDPEAYLREAQSHLIDQSLMLPALFTALLATRAAGRPMPYGRGKLLYLYARELCERAAQTDDELSAPEVAHSLGALAASLQGAQRSCLPLGTLGGLGDQVANWLEAHEPLSPTDASLREPPTFTVPALESHCKAALRVGILKRQFDGLTLGFAHPLLQEAFAAMWFSLQDDGLGRLNPELLREQWVFPTLLWAGAKDDAADLAQRLFRFANSPISIAPRLGLANPMDVYPLALALALVAVIEGATPQLVRLNAQGATHRTAFALPQQHLRDLLDKTLIYAAKPEGQTRMAHALQTVERAAGPELVTHIVTLIHLSALDRLLRAQVITLLGLISSEPSLATLMDLLSETDPTLRQAVNQSLAYAGAAALAPLQMRLRDPKELVRSRAAEALTYMSETTPDTADAALAAARLGLTSGDARQRRTAAETLGSLRALEALDALIERLDDGESAVRVAAARALGQIGGKRARAALRKRSDSSDVTLRVAIAQALGASPDPLSTPTLLRLLEDADPRVRVAAAIALGMLGDERAVGPLREHRDDPDPWAQNAAISALRRLGRG
ncbi:MAG TPA: HEAT repeat domain-containing protein [Ktedonobacterales bacterium]|nr:HEAT repeat domain-containing protein [Ktedonobacterales bacterium]